MNKYWTVVLFLLSSVNLFSQSKSQTKSLQPVTPKQEYTIEYIDSLTETNPEPGNDFTLIHQKTGKRIKLRVPPEKFVGKVFFITDYLVDVHVLGSTSQWQSTPSFHYLIGFVKDTVYLLENHKVKGFNFREVSLKPCFIQADKDLFDKKGNYISSSFWFTPKSNSYEIQCMDCTDKADSRRYYNKNCEKTDFTMRGATNVHDLGNHIAYFWLDTLFFFDLINNKEKGPFLTVPLTARNNFYYAKSEPTLDKMLDQEKLFPVCSSAGKWMYLNENGEPAFKPFSADLALPFTFSNGQAAVYYKNKWGTINKKGVITHDFVYDSLSLGANQQYTYFFRNDSAFIMNPEGFIQPMKNSTQTESKPNNQPVTKQWESTCLVYQYENPNKKVLEERFAYILVNLSYDKNNIDHTKMVDWVAGAIQSEQSAMWAAGYGSTSTVFSNQYKADIIYEGKGCYHLESEYNQKSLWVKVINHTF